MSKTTLDVTEGDAIQNIKKRTVYWNIDDGEVNWKANGNVSFVIDGGFNVTTTGTINFNTERVDVD